MTQYVGLDVSLKETKLHLIPLRLLQRCVGTLPTRSVLDSRLDH